MRCGRPLRAIASTLLSLTTASRIPPECRADARRLRLIKPIKGLVVADHGANDVETRKRIVRRAVKALRRGLYSARVEREDHTVLVPDRAIIRTDHEGRESLPCIVFGSTLRRSSEDDGFEPAEAALRILSAPFGDEARIERIVSALRDLATIDKDAEEGPRDRAHRTHGEFAPTPWLDRTSCRMTHSPIEIMGRDKAVTDQQPHTRPSVIGQDTVRIPICVEAHIADSQGKAPSIHIGPLHGSVSIIHGRIGIRERSFDTMETLRVVERLRREFPA